MSPFTGPYTSNSSWLTLFEGLPLSEFDRPRGKFSNQNYSPGTRSLNDLSATSDKAVRTNYSSFPTCFTISAKRARSDSDFPLAGISKK